MKSYNIYARYLCDVEKIDDLNTYPLPADDIVDITVIIGVRLVTQSTWRLFQTTFQIPRPSGD